MHQVGSIYKRLFVKCVI